MDDPSRTDSFDSIPGRNAPVLKDIAEFILDPRIGESWADYLQQEHPPTRERGERVIRALYRSAGLSEPRIIWQSHPGEINDYDSKSRSGWDAKLKRETDRHGNIGPLPGNIAASTEDVELAQRAISGRLHQMLATNWPGLHPSAPNYSMVMKHRKDLLRSRQRAEPRNKAHAPRRQAARRLEYFPHGPDRDPLGDQDWQEWTDQSKVETPPARDIAWDLTCQLHDDWDSSWLGMKNWRGGFCHVFWQNLAASWLALPAQEHELARLWRDLRDTFSVLWTSPTFCVAVLLPRIRLDSFGRYHCENGPAVEYPSGFRLFYWHGKEIPPRFALKPGKIEMREIESEENTEVRHTLLQRYGHDRYLKDKGLQEIHRDGRAILYRRYIPDEEPFLCVRVIGGSPQAEGKPKDYLLRVPPEMRTAREAVAWTFCRTVDEYDPDCES